MNIPVRYEFMYEYTHGKQPSIDFSTLTARPEFYRSASPYEYAHSENILIPSFMSYMYIHTLICIVHVFIP